MKIAAYLNIISPHQLPLARAIVDLVGEGNFRYVYWKGFSKERAGLGWCADDLPNWCVPLEGNEKILQDADLVYVGGLRPMDFLERRFYEGKKTVYLTERWFKPIHGLPGWLRMLVPSYQKAARRMVRWLNDDPNAKCLAIGPWAARDMRRLGVKLGKIVPWGYFVEPSKLAVHALPAEMPKGEVRLLWVGRLLGLKRVDDIVRAVRAHDRLKRVDDSLPKITLDVYGSGVEEPRLRRMVAKYGLDGLIKFHPSVPIAEVRRLMHEHDVYVLSSNAYEGWGAVVSEALEEGMKVIGTYEAGSCAAILPGTNLYHAGDWRRLAELIRSDIPFVGVGEWTAKRAAEKLVAML